MIYKLTEKAKLILWKKWVRDGGGGISGYASGEIADSMNRNGSKFDMTNLTLGEISDMSGLAEREIAHYAATNWGPLDLALPNPWNDQTS